jgi:hypothetical protein
VEDAGRASGRVRLRTHIAEDYNVINRHIGHSSEGTPCSIQPQVGPERSLAR